MPTPDAPNGPRPLGRTATRLLVVASVLLAFAVAIAGALYLIRTAREAAPAPPDAPDSTSAYHVPPARPAEAAPPARSGALS